MNTVEVLVVGGGGYGGSNGGGGGGGGGLLYEAAHAVTVKEYHVVVGVGSQDSVFDTLVAKAGGHGANRDYVAPASIGGSGGGGANYWTNGGSALGADGIAGQGHAGGDHIGRNQEGGGSGGGGGGAGAPGGDSNVGVAGAGGDGVECSISGTAVYYAGGGGGGVTIAGTIGAGGQGGGGHGGNNTNNETPGTPHTGGGGGGGGHGLQGGSGIVIIRYLTGSLLGVGGTITVDGLYTIHTFTVSAYFTVYLPMLAAINIADTWKAIKWGASRLNVAHAWRVISALYINEGNAWKQIYPLFLMLEDRSHVLLESGDKIVMEDQ